MVTRKETKMYTVIITNAYTAKQHRRSYCDMLEAWIEYRRCCDVAERLNSEFDCWYIELYDEEEGVYISDDLADTEEGVA